MNKINIKIKAGERERERTKYDRIKENKKRVGANKSSR